MPNKTAAAIATGLACAFLLAAAALGQGTTAPLQEGTPPVQNQQLEPGDLIAVQVAGAPELRTEARLAPNGTFTMPYTGRVRLEGETAAQASRTLAARLRQNYLLDPQVQVVVRAFAPEPVTVLGAVRAPGVYSARTYPDLGAMLAAAGGVRAPAAARVLVEPGQGEPITAVPVTALERGSTAAAMRLRAGYVIRVAPGGQVYVGGNVARPGAYPIPASGMTMLEAISLAGGALRNSRLGQTRIVHRDPGGKLATEWVNAGSVMQGHAPDPHLHPFDLVYIPWSPAKAGTIAGVQLAATTVAQIIFGIIAFHWTPPQIAANSSKLGNPCVAQPKLCQ
ncbi:MAG: polysaccharide biosynthesis/export family protein [Terriglobales bacterium]